LTTAQTAAQSDITTLDTSILALINQYTIPSTVTDNITVGTGLYDQLANIIAAAGLTSTEGGTITSGAATLLAAAPTDVQTYYTAKTALLTAIQAVEAQSGTNISQVGTEISTLSGMVSNLQSFSSANVVTGLFSSDVGIQTLMGYIATDDFLQDLGAA
jgi:hypothetical protein